MLMNAQQQLITVMIMQPVRIQWDHLHVLVIADLLGTVSLVQVSFIHSTKHELYNINITSNIFTVQWYPCKSYQTVSLTYWWHCCQYVSSWPFVIDSVSPKISPNLEEEVFMLKFSFFEGVKICIYYKISTYCDL